MKDAFEKWWIEAAGYETGDWRTPDCKQAFLAGRAEGLDEAAKVFSTNITTASAHKAILALKDKP